MTSIRKPSHLGGHSRYSTQQIVALQSREWQRQQAVHANSFSLFALYYSTPSTVDEYCICTTQRLGFPPTPRCRAIKLCWFPRWHHRCRSSLCMSAGRNNCAMDRHNLTLAHHMHTTSAGCCHNTTRGMCRERSHFNVHRSHGRRWRGSGNPAAVVTLYPHLTPCVSNPFDGECNVKHAHSVILKPRICLEQKIKATSMSD